MSTMPTGGQMPKLDAKNLTYLDDALTYEALACKKCEQYANNLTDPAPKNLVTQLAQHHRQNYDNLLNYLNSHQ